MSVSFRLCVFCAAACTLVAGQKVAEFRATTQLVQINVVVTDKNGPVEGLTREDFVLYDEYKRREIVFFDAHRRRKASPAERIQPAAQGEYTNVSEGAAPEDPGAVVIVWDLINTPYPYQMLAKGAVLESLSVVRPGDHVGIYILGTTLTVIRDFTSESSQLADTLEKYTRKPDLWGGAGEQVKLGGRSVDDSIIKMRGERTRAEVKAIMRRLAGIPGRKSVIWISAEVPGLEDWNPNCPLYLVDAMGLRAVTEILPDKDASRFPRVGETRLSAPPPPAVGFSPVPLRMQRAAEQTGGRAFINSNDIRGAIEQALADNAVSYTLGFYPRLSEKDTSDYHHLKVEVKRRAVSVRYPKSYPTKPATPTLEEVMNSALTDNLEYTQLRLTAKVERDGSALRVPISIRSVSGLQDSNGRFAGRIDYLVAQRSSNSDVLDLVSRSVTLNQDAAQRERTAEEGLRLTETVVPKVGLASIRIVVSDQSSGAMGALTIPVVAEPNGTAASGTPEKDDGMPVSRTPDSGMVSPPGVASARPESGRLNESPAAALHPQEDPPAGGRLSGDPLLRRAAQAAGELAAVLPNFICREVVVRSESVSGGKRWRPIDTIEAELILENGREVYRHITVNGSPVSRTMEDLSGTRSTGEFATLVRMLFAPSTDARFQFIVSVRPTASLTPPRTRA